MFSRRNILKLYCSLTLLIVYFNQPVLTLVCFECVSTFPGNNICLPSCSQTDRANSTACLLTRNIPLESGFEGSVRAGHISQEPVLSDAEEKYFLYGEEAVYQNPSVAVGWDWEYGPITYGCNTSGCNNPQNVNSLPNALNARITDETLTRLLTGDLINTCYACNNLNLTENLLDTDMSKCQPTNCPQYSCNFVATRQSGGWRFSSGCILSRVPAQVDMTLMYYINSEKTVVYQMEATCLSDNCNTISTFKQLKDAIGVDPDLSCLANINTTSTTSTSTSSVSPSGSSSSTTTGGPGVTTTTTTGGPAVTTTTTRGPGVTTTTATGGPGVTTTTTAQPTTSSGEQDFLNTKLFILTIFSFYIIKF
ncbi:unnamed protein product [Adineta steineri]|uniref:Uncharacterized protein n=1 Tax=Adineta steineri TaxID=433720 RepID=A0A814HJK4_9BILA|nr:unnamed protein product [Adineta steineri]CAF1078164.1 unnamed protein product [Adineta steineri]CAF1087996.1 unnamed protein product [Adineta steineri]